MRRLIVTLLPLLLISTLVLSPAGCKRRKKQPAQQQEEPAGMATMVHAADPRSAPQLLRGFHGVEEGAWRWTQKSFAVTLRPPQGAALHGANLILKFAVPDVVLKKVGPM